MKQKSSLIFIAIAFLAVIFTAGCVIKPANDNTVTATISQSVREKIDPLIIGKLNSEDKINVIIYSFEAPNQDMVQTLQSMGAENVKLIESEQIKKEGIETVTKGSEPLFITATIKAKNAVSIAELSWVRMIILLLITETDLII